MNDQQRPLISIIVPVYNSEKFLLRCIKSIQNQTYNNIEIVLIDDGSTDSSGEICDQLALKDSRITVCHKVNGGQASARNLGLEIANGELVGFVDNDDVIEPNMYELLYRNMIREGVKISGLVADWVYEDKTTFEGNKYQSRIYTGHELLINMFYKINLISSSVWDKLFKRELFSNVKFPEGCEFEDIWVLSQIFLQNPDVYIEMKPLYHWYQYSFSRSKSGFNDKSKTYVEIPKKIVTSYKAQNADQSLIDAATNFLLLGYIKFFGKVFVSNCWQQKVLIRKYQRELKNLMIHNNDEKVKKSVRIKCWLLSGPFIREYCFLWRIKNRRTSHML